MGKVLDRYFSKNIQMANEHMKILNIMNHYGNINKNYNEITLHIH